VSANRILVLIILFIQNARASVRLEGPGGRGMITGLFPRRSIAARSPSWPPGDDRDSGAVLNLLVPATSPFHCLDFVALFGKYLCYAAGAGDRP